MRKRTRRKVWALVDTIKHAIEGASVTSGQDLDRLRLVELAAIQAFATGRARLQEWHDISEMLNLAEGMANMGIGRDEVLPACKEAQAHLVEAARRYQATMRMGTTGPGLQAFRELFAYHDLQRTSIPRSQYELAIKTVTNRIKSKAPEVIEL